MATLTDLKNKIDTTFPGKLYSLSCEFSNVVSDIRYTETATEQDKAGIQAIVDAFDWDAPAPNPDKFTDDIWQDVNLKPVRMTLVGFKGLLKEYLGLDAVGQQRIKEAWLEDIKPQFDAVNPAIAVLVVAHASNNGIELE